MRAATCCLKYAYARICCSIGRPFREARTSLSRTLRASHYTLNILNVCNQYMRPELKARAEGPFAGVTFSGCAQFATYSISNITTARPKRISSPASSFVPLAVRSGVVT